MGFKSISVNSRDYVVCRNGKFYDPYSGKYAKDPVGNRTVLLYDHTEKVPGRTISVSDLICNADNSYVDLFEEFNVKGNPNDPRIVWHLFEKMKGRPVILRNGRAWKITDKYYVPASYLKKSNYSKWVELPDLEINRTEIVRTHIKDVRAIKSNASLAGDLIEDMIAEKLGATVCHTEKVFAKNNSQLLPVKGKKQRGIKKNLSEDHISFVFKGSVERIESEFENEKPNIERIYVLIEKLRKKASALYPFLSRRSRKGIYSYIGKAKERADRRKYHPYFSKALDDIKRNIDPIINELSGIFKSDAVYRHELVKNSKWKVMAQCDLSSKNAVVEIKSCHVGSRFDYQVYFESAGRDAYIVGMDWKGYDCDVYVLKYEFKVKPA